MKNYKKIFVFVLLFLNVFLLNAQQNTILIIGDDVSPDYFGVFSPTTDTANTPNIRKLAQRGVKFTKVWSAPVCSPTRAGILTGRYSFRTGVGGVITNASSPQLDTAEISISKLLKYAAPLTYNTACIGKWHLTSNMPMKRLYPNKLGFDLYSGNFNGTLPNYYNYQRIRNGISDTVKTYATTQTVNEAVDWLGNLNKNKPFFLWLAFNAPHDPYHLPPASLCNTNGLTGTTAHIAANPKKYFKAALEAMDTEFGRLLKYLEDNNLTANTNIIFICDNGNQSQVAQITNKNKSKGSIYDYGINVPMIVAGPSTVGMNRISNELINTNDIFATIAEMSNFTTWKNSIPSTTIIDSKSFLPILQNKTATYRDWIFSETFNTPTTADDGKTIRNKDYHLLRFDNGKEEFYNQTLDKLEDNNLLLNINKMTSTDISNYQFLCKSISTLLGKGTCQKITATEFLSSENAINVFPNPTSEFLVIRLMKDISLENLKIELLDMNGKLMQTTTLLQGSTLTYLDTKTLSNGTYLLKISSEKEVLTKKVEILK